MVDAMGFSWRLFFVVLLLTTTEALQTRGTIVTVPNRLTPGKNTTICVVFSGGIKSGSVTYNFTSTESENSILLIAEERFTISSEGVTCVNLLLPKEYSQEFVNFGAEVSAHDYKFSEIKKLGVFTEGSEFTLIQTDKPVYKPGQAVKIRLMTLTTDLLPVLDQKYDVWITDPSGVRIEQWLDVPTIKGFAQLEFMLNTEPPLGKWNITCHVSKRREKAFFMVREYVLPRFEVTIKAPHSISVDDDLISGEVCASYTYGQPVKGLASISIAEKSTDPGSISRQERESRHALEIEINGCAAFNLSVRHFGLQNRTDGDQHCTLEISAIVTEQGTDVQVNASSVTVKISLLRATIAITGNDMYKPGLDYSGKVKVTKGDGSPLAEQLVEIVVRDERSEIPLRATYSTNESGEVTYTLPTLGGFIHQYVTETTLLTGITTHEWQRPRATKRIDPWYSPSGSYLQLQAPSEISRLSCGHEAQIDLHYTTNESQEVNLTLQVAGLNNIVLSSSTKMRLIPQRPITWAFTSHGMDDDESSATGLSNPTYSTPSLRGRQASKNIRTSHRGQTKLSINITSAMAPVARLLVFYTRPDGEIVADALSLDVEKCVPNNVTMVFEKRRVRPGEEVRLKLAAEPKSLCAYETVDKSVYLIDRGNQINVERLYGRLEQYMNSPETDTLQDEQQHCERQFIQTPNNSSNGSLIRDSSTRRTHNLWRPYSTLYKDSSHAFDSSSTAVLTDLTIGTRPCTQNYRNGKLLLSMAHYSPEVESPGDGDDMDTNLATNNIVNVRTHFPETWLWNVIEIGENGKERLDLPVPHTITKWEGSAICVHETRGFGVSQVAAVTVFQPFFVSVKLPYAVIRDESVPIIATVFNYYSAPLLVELTLENSTDFTITDEKSHTILCICSRNSQSHRYTVVPNKIGIVNITINTVSSMNVSGCRSHCNISSNHSDVAVFHDAVVKHLLVQPEGLPRKDTRSSFVCVRMGSKNVSWSVPLPKDFVPQSQRAYLSVIGDVMGPSLANLENLLQMPWGCGEQNMLGFAPNIFVMQYLEATQQASDAIRSKAVGYMKSGYQRQLTYSHPDRSYSAFGTSDPEGSIWLTAFVVKCFAHSRRFIYIDDSHLNASMHYFSQHQKSNGCFREVGKVIHKGMKGGLTDTPDSQATLTAYIVISLLEANAQEQEAMIRMIRKAIECLDKKNVSDAYSLALLSYAYTLYGANPNRTEELSARLHNMANSQRDGALYWRVGNNVAKQRESNTNEPQHNQPTAVEVETAAYALLALLKRRDGVEHSRQIVRWLTKQRNPYGGFVSTQDTILAIQALSQFAAASYSGNMNMTVRFQHENKTGAFKVHNRNNLQLQSTSLDLTQSQNMRLAVSFSGIGCALAQLNVRYNVKVTAKLRSAFETNVTICQSAGPGAKRKSCKQQALAVCTRYNGADTASNMAIVEVNMVSGWTADKDSIRLLQSNKALGLKRFEVNEKTVYFYFEQITKESKCFQFELTQEQEVEHTKGVAVTTYDYYNPGIRHETDYNLNTHNCPNICRG